MHMNTLNTQGSSIQCQRNHTIKVVEACRRAITSANRTALKSRVSVSAITNHHNRYTHKYTNRIVFVNTQTHTHTSVCVSVCNCSFRYFIQFSSSFNIILWQLWRHTTLNISSINFTEWHRTNQQLTAEIKNLLHATLNCPQCH